MVRMDDPVAVVTGVSVPKTPVVTVSFETFYEEESSRLFRALGLLTGSRHEAEDLEQEAFFRVWERWDRVAQMEDPSGYLYRTAMNLYRSAARRALRTAKKSIGLAPSDDPPTAAEARDEFARWLAALTARQRAAVILTELVGRTPESAAELLGVQPGTIYALVSQARAALKTITEVADE
jgi:RNA polymerase sigma factor (sigma-70 family)